MKNFPLPQCFLSGHWGQKEHWGSEVAMSLPNPQAI
jgi:hypothetical protein